ncbi:thioredoxin, mitochondrial-like [Biomphalaria glabrata]|uniref:Thioredoxin, mitochondrial-like n=1 Tax=Biomphalaria glabrata TaxID=6526 RepID=A0A182YTQ5_BIOGL|nr:thioredoxin, mitochondrial-like [Biomphalaria glabrata]XP_055876768.1 thioredoxin, mitochondrial-like [Biomphalaria glabrata]XP_055876769.1 thioredoxin, mitochondrial-like [Biomphalaria glabrata]
MNVARQILCRAATCSSVRNIMVSRVGFLERSLPQMSVHEVHSKLENCNRLASTSIRLCSTAAKKFEVINVQDEEDFKKRVIEASNNTPVVVDFHATWCGPCKLLGPRLESILAEEGKVIMAKVDIDEISELAMAYGVRSVPTVIGLRKGQVCNQFIGLVDDDQIRTFVKKLVVS